MLSQLIFVLSEWLILCIRSTNILFEESKPFEWPSLILLANRDTSHAEELGWNLQKRSYEIYWLQFISLSGQLLL